METTVNNRNTEDKRYEILTGIIVSIGSLTAGTAIGWSAPVNSKLAHPEWNDTPLGEAATESEVSWIGSLLALGAFITPFIGGPLADKIGRKWTLLSSSLFFIISYALLITTSSVTQIYIARLLQGFGIGFVMTVQPMYVGEIASDSIRGALGSLMQLFVSTGILYVYAIGPYVSYSLLQWLCLVIPILFAVSFYFMPHSPHFLMTQGRRESTKEALKRLRRKSSRGVKSEINDLEINLREYMAQRGTYSSLFKSAVNTKALVISVGLLVFQQLSGINAVLFYSTNIFLKASGDKEGGLDANVSTILVGAVMVIASGITPFIVDRLGRKIILLFSATGMALSLGGLGLYFFLDNQGSPVVESITWLPVTSLIIYVLVFCVGFGPLPWAIMGEMFSPEVKSKGSAIVASVAWFLGFCVTRWFGALDAAIGTHWTFWGFGFCCIGAFLFTLTVVIETKGLSLQQIQAKLMGR